MMSAVQSLSFAAYFCNSTAQSKLFADRAALILQTWFIDPATRMLPNLFYGQIMPSAKLRRPGHGGFIEWTALAPMLDAVIINDRLSSESTALSL